MNNFNYFLKFNCLELFNFNSKLEIKLAYFNNYYHRYPPYPNFYYYPKIYLIKYFNYCPITK